MLLSASVMAVSVSAAFTPVISRPSLSSRDSVPKLGAIVRLGSRMDSTM
jgi:hypothetical protein